MRNITWQAFILLLTFGSASDSSYAQTLNVAASDLALQIKTILEERRIQPPAVSVGQFELHPKPSPYSSLGFQNLLRLELEQARIATNHNEIKIEGKIRLSPSFCTVSGSIHVADEPPIPIGRRGKFDRKIQDEVDRQEKKSATAGKPEPVAAVVSNSEDLSTLAATTHEATGLSIVDRRDQKVYLEDVISDAIKNPEVYVKGSTVSAYDDSLFRIELLLKDSRGYYSMNPAVTQRRGYAYVELKEGDEFAIRIINNASFDVGAKIMIDGLDSFSFSRVDAYRELQLYHIPRLNGNPPHLAPGIAGWHIDNKNVHAFNITSLPKGAAYALGRESSGEIGVISVQFFPSWGANEEPPAVEFGKSRISRGIKLSVGRGEVRKQSFAEVQQNFGKTIVGSISVRYQHP